MRQKEEVKEVSMRGLDLLLLGLKMEKEAHEQGMLMGSRSRGQPLARTSKEMHPGL